VTSGTVQNYTYAYDRYGNRWQTPLQTGYSFNPTYSTTTNHITSSGYGYDAAGNMTNDTFHSYKYDAEGNIVQVDTGSTATTYVYDVLNHRIHVQTASATTEFLYDYAGRSRAGCRPTTLAMRAGFTGMGSRLPIDRRTVRRTSITRTF
jgi:YD repeat-containing protein